MASPEHLLISRVIYHPEEFTEVVTESHVGAKHFHDDEHGAVWDWLVEHWDTYGKVPGRDALRMEYPNYSLAKVPEPLRYYVDLINGAHRRFETVSMIREASEMVSDDEDVEGARRLLADRLLELEQDTYITADDNLNSTWADRVKEYQRIADMDGELIGIPTGFPTFDLITGGFQPEQFIVLIGPQKAGKSSIMLRSAWAANQAGYRVLFIGFEMSNREQAARYDGMRGGFNYNLLMHGRMGRKERARLEEVGRQYENLPEMIFVHDMNSATTMTAVGAKIQQFKPDIVFIDGVYMMDSEIPGVDSMDTRALTKISRGCKRLCQTRKIPLVISTQALDWKWSKKEGLTAKAAGYTSAFGQDCDYMFGIEPADDEDQTAKMRLILGRTAPRKLILVEFDWDHGSIEEQKLWGDGSSIYGDDEDYEESYGRPA